MNLLDVKKIILILCVGVLASCSGASVTKPEAKAPATRQPNTAQTPAVKSVPPITKNDTNSDTAKPGSGGYYLDDGPGENAPADIDGIPDAKLKTEAPLVRANKPYSALGQRYTPMTKYMPYKKQGIASWYGKRFHGRKTANGEVYDMYAMTGAHTTLPLPSYVKVTNPANGRSVIVRINDRGPFKHSRLIDLSYAAAHKLRLISKGSGLVEVETIDTSPEAMLKNSNNLVSNNSAAMMPEVAIENTAMQTTQDTGMVKTNFETKSSNEVITDTKIETSITSNHNSGYYVQAGAFKNEINGELLQKKIQGLALAENVGLANVYNNGLYRVKLGPFAGRSEADATATKIRKQLNTAAIVTNQ
ncbi:MAG TPA: septal ring lytic transglycosylase RlpA family protein [Methylotenera sp.]|nr:septal ring lytic transglycosylase RlpA family protein [Methylotenera sp.]